MTDSVIDSFVDRSAALASAPCGDAPWLRALRAGGLERLRADGFPTRRQEAWRFTDLRPLLAEPFAEPGRNIGAAKELLSRSPAVGAAHCLVFVNGHFSHDLSYFGSLPEGVSLSAVSGLLAVRGKELQADFCRIAAPWSDPLLGLNASLTQDGFVLRLSRGAKLDQPVHVVFIGDAEARASWHPHNLILAGANTTATVIETHVGLDGVAYFSNPVTEVDVQAGAAIDHVRLVEDGDSALTLARMQVQQDANSRFESTTLTTGGALSRAETDVRLAGRGAVCRIDGVYLGKGARQIDTITTIEHAVSDTHSSETFKGVLDDAALGVFQGRIVVQPDAQQIKGHQLHRGLLLSDKAGVHVKPELEIFADDVQCSHGCTIGELNREQLFYMRARGVPEPVARRMLVEAFMREVTARIADERVREDLDGRVGAWMARRNAP